MKYFKKEIKKGVCIHLINTDKFKTNLIAVFLKNRLNKEKVTKNAIIPMVLKRGTNNLTTYDKINKKLEEMYGGYFNCGIDKIGDSQVLKFVIETINDKYLPNRKENMINQSIDMIFDIIFNPYIERNGFKKEYVEQEKENLRNRILGRVDNKAGYAFNRCIEEMYKNEPYGLYKFGKVEDLESIDERNLYDYYKKMIDSCQIDIFVSGNIDEETFEFINNSEYMKRLLDREIDITNKNEKKIENIKKEKKYIEEKMNVVQGKLVIGLNVNIDTEEEKYTAMIYNSILGGSANSKLFQNVREKANLAYIASSTFIRNKNSIFINCGIEIENYNEAVKLIREQLKSISKGEFTKEDIDDNKEVIIDGLESIKDEQDSQITYLYGQKINNKKVSIDEYIEKIKEITKEQIIEVANKIEINTIYFLRN